MLRITNNRKKAEMSMGYKMPPEELEAALSGDNLVKFFSLILY